MNLNPVAEPPLTGSNRAPTQILKHFLKFPAELTIFKPNLMFRQYISGSSDEDPYSLTSGNGSSGILFVFRSNQKHFSK